MSQGSVMRAAPGKINSHLVYIQLKNKSIWHRPMSAKRQAELFSEMADAADNEHRPITVQLKGWKKVR